MASDLVERLRAMPAAYGALRIDAAEAADEIASLRQRVEAAEREKDDEYARGVKDERERCDAWKTMESAPVDGTAIEGLTADGQVVLVQWAESRRCMLAGIGGGNGYFGAGWQDVENRLIADDPILWRSQSNG